MVAWLDVVAGGSWRQVLEWWLEDIGDEIGSGGWRSMVMRMGVLAEGFW